MTCKTPRPAGHLRIRLLAATAVLALCAACDRDVDTPDPSSLAADPATPETNQQSAALLASTSPTVATPPLELIDDSKLPPVGDPGQWEVANGPGGPLPIDVRDAMALAKLEAHRETRRRLFDAARPDSPDRGAHLIAVITGQHPAHERATALRALGGHRNDAALPTIIGALDDPDFGVKTEAAVTLMLWGEVAAAMPHLKELARHGALVRRAFLVESPEAPAGHGGLTLRPEARDFFRTALASPVPAVRVDAAIGLLELGEPNDALAVLENYALHAERSDQRHLAIARMAPLRDLQPVRTLLARAAQHADPETARLARAAIAHEVTP